MAGMHQKFLSGPQVVNAHEGFQVIGLRSVSPLFPSRKKAEAWMATEIAKLPPRLQPKVRSCLCCKAEFNSEGIHHRLCDRCRHNDAGPVPVTYARPSRLREGARA